MHVEATIAVNPRPAPAWTPVEDRHHGLPIELLITAAGAAAVVAWHVRRSALDLYVRA
jgi:hypothetical protein